jgi:hypothetical protein
LSLKISESSLPSHEKKKQTKRKRKRKPDRGELRLETHLSWLRVLGGTGVELGGDDDFRCGGSGYIGGSELGFRVRAVWWLGGLWAVLRPFSLRRWVGAATELMSLEIALPNHELGSDLPCLPLFFPTSQVTNISPSPLSKEKN